MYPNGDDGCLLPVSSFPNSTIAFTSLFKLSQSLANGHSHRFTGCLLCHKVCGHLGWTLVRAWKQLRHPYLRAHYNLLQPWPRLVEWGIAYPEMPEHERLPRLGKFPLTCITIGMLQAKNETKELLETTHMDRPQLAIINIIDMVIGSCLPSTASWSVTLYDSTRPVSLRKLSSGLTPGYSILYVQQIRSLVSERSRLFIWTCLLLTPLKTLVNVRHFLF